MVFVRFNRRARQSLCAALVHVQSTCVPACRRPNSTSFIPRHRARLVLIMSERQPRPYDDIARKWHALAERRCAHVVELRDSGRWRHYYTWDELLDALREAVDTRDTWARLAGLAEDETPGPTGAAVASEVPEHWLDAELFRKAS